MPEIPGVRDWGIILQPNRKGGNSQGRQRLLNRQPYDCDRMSVNLSSKARKLLFAGVCLAAIGLYLAAIARHFEASQLAARLNPLSLNRSAGLEPWDALPRWELGRYCLFVAQNPTAAVANLQRAAALNPHMARYWLDLASAYEVTGSVERQRLALQRAVATEPTAPAVAWEAANFYLVHHNLKRALPLFRVAMANDPAQLDSALRLCWRATRDINAMLAEAVPAEPLAYFAFLRLLAEGGQPEPAETVWNRLQALGQPFPVADAFPFFDYLITQHQTAAAAHVWQQLLQRRPSLQAYAEPGNLILDGGLEQQFLNGGFDWRYSRTDAMELSVDNTEFHRGNQSLRMVFKGPAITDLGFMEYVPVKPNTDYRFQAYTKAEDLESASGPRLAVLDAYSGRQYVLTADSLGTTGWREQSAEFRTAPDSSLLVVKATRVPGDPLIKGKFWLDDMSLAQR